MTNHKPIAPSGDDALWERIIVIPFEQRFLTEPKLDGEHKADKGLKEKLQAEASGILNWLIEGCRKWQEEGLNVPEKCKIATQNYRTEQDMMWQFIQEALNIGPGEVDTIEILWSTFEAWLSDHKADFPNPPTKATFGKRLGDTLKRYGFYFERPEKGEYVYGKQQKVYKGISVNKDHTVDRANDRLTAVANKMKSAQ